MGLASRDIIEFRDQRWMIRDWNHDLDEIHLVSWHGRSLRDADGATVALIYSLPMIAFDAVWVRKHCTLVASYCTGYIPSKRMKDEVNHGAKSKARV